MIKKYSEEKRQGVIEARKAGATIAQIATQPGVGRTTVKTWLKDAGLTVNRKWKSDEIQTILKEYEECRSPKTIREKYGISKSELYRLRKKMQADQRIVVKDYTVGQIAAMKRKLATLEEENQIFRQSGCGTSASIDEKIAAVKQLQDDFTIHAICRTLNLAKGTFYNRLYRTPAETVFDQRNNELSPIIREIFDASNGRFGANMIHVKMREQGIVVSKKHIKTLMDRMQLVSRQMTPVLFNTRSRSYVFRKNLVCQKFKADLPNVLWVSDVTFIRAGDVFHSLCVIIDVFSRKVIAHKISINNDTALILETFQEAFIARGNPSGVTFHSDQGRNYTSYAFRNCLREHGVHQSFSNPATPHDNAVAEAFFSVLKREDISHSYYQTREDLEKAVTNYIEFYNSMRPHRKLHNLSPNDFERSFVLAGI